MATLAPRVNITLQQVKQKISHLQQNWQQTTKSYNDLMPTEIDEFDRCQLEKVLEICQNSALLSETGRALFAVSRNKNSTATMRIA